MAISIYSTSNVKLIMYLIILRIYHMHQITVSYCLQAQQNQDQGQEKQGRNQTNQCSNNCDDLQIPFPFYLNSSSSYYCGGNSSLDLISDAFRLSCVEQDKTSQVVYLNIDSQRYRVIDIDTFGVKLESAIQRNSSKAQCSLDAYTIKATFVPLGIRCQCSIGLVGDDFAHGLGCSSSCLKNGREAFGNDCFTEKRHRTRKVKILIGVFASALILASLTAIFFLLKRSANKSTVLLGDKYNEGANSAIEKVSKTRLFRYNELEQATKGFDDGNKLVGGSKGELYVGVLGDGSHVAIHKLQNLIEEKELVSKSVEVLSTVHHGNLARVLGCCIDTSLLVVYEHPNNSTLEKHLMLGRVDDVGLEWSERLKVASDTACLIAFLRYNISPPIIHQDLNPGFIFVDHDCCVKIAGFVPLNENLLDTNSSSDDVYSMGLLLVDLISGVGEKRLPTKTALGKIKSGKVGEIVDPYIYYDEHKEEIEVIADLATRCLLFGDKLGMKNVAKELMHLLHNKHPPSSNRSNYSNTTTLGLGGSTSSNTTETKELEETFSNCSLLQMMSMSPDSIFAPHFSV